MKAIELIASSLNRTDDVPNQMLAQQIIETQNSAWIKELTELLSSRDKNIQSDSIKVLYEIGEGGNPELIAPYYRIFIDLLKSKNNRLVWGAMYALSSITLIKPDEIVNDLSIIEETIKKGSVITIDCGVAILAKLCSIKKYEQQVLPKLIEQLAICPAKQFPMYIEKSGIAFNPSTREDFLGIIDLRYNDLDKDSQRKRVNKMRKELLK